MNHSQGWISGNLATDVRHRVTGSGRHMAQFRLASNRRWVDSGGQQRESTSYVAVRCFGALADNVTSSLRKGDAVLVVGRFEVEETERDGHRSRDMVVLASAAGPDLSMGTAMFQCTLGAQSRLASGTEQAA
jgi:single-strand DNA-binding protein